MTFVVFITTTMLLWRPAITQKEGPRFHGCPDPRERVTISALKVPPYTSSSKSGEVEGILGDFFSQIVYRCFIKHCRLPKDIFKTTLINSTEDFVKILQQNKTDFAFPVSAAMKMFLTSANHSTSHSSLLFEVFINSPGYSLIMDVDNVNLKANKAAFHNLYENTWTIAIFAFLIAGISGMVIWILETFFNAEEFPRSFTKGSYEGFWWAFVTMTTVGYGDKTPKSVLGRVFGVLWIMFGLVVVALFTATATSALSININDYIRVEGNKIGVLNNTSAKLQARQSGAFVHTFSSAQEMFTKLRNDEIEGVLMDKFRAATLLNAMKEKKFRVFHSYHEIIPYYLAVRHADSLRGVMLQNSCFKTLIEKRDLESLFVKYLTPVMVYNAERDSHTLFYGESPSTQKFLLRIMGVFLGLAFVGITAELIYRIVRKPDHKVKSGEGGINLKEVKVQHTSVDLKDLKDEIGQLVKAVGKLEEKVTVISSGAPNGSFRWNICLEDL